jgi:hypothetical protein
MTNTNPPLHLAVQNGNIAIVKMLLDAGHDLNAVNADGQTPLDWAITINNTEIIQLLQTHTEIVLLLPTHIEVADTVQRPSTSESLVRVNVLPDVVFDDASSTNTNGHSRSAWKLFAEHFYGICSAICIMCIFCFILSVVFEDPLLWRRFIVVGIGIGVVGVVYVVVYIYNRVLSLLPLNIQDMINFVSWIFCVLVALLFGFLLFLVNSLKTH